MDLFEQRYKALVSSHADLVSRYLPDGTLIFVSPSYLQFFGRSEEDLLGSCILDLVQPVFRDGVSKRLASLTLSNPVVRGENTVFTSQGDLRTVEWVTNGIFDEAGTLVECQSVGRDVTDRKEAETALAQSQMRYGQAVKIAGIGHWVWDDLNDKLTFWSDQAAVIYGLSVQDSLARSDTSENSLMTIHPDDRDIYDLTIKEADANLRGYDIIFRIIRPDGETRYIHEIGEPMIDDSGQITQSIGTVQDITERKKTEDEIKHLARHDPLTNLPNRHLFFDRLGMAMEAAKRSSLSLAVLFIDLDGFKPINDRYGHQCGDRLLQQVAGRLSENVRASDTVARLGGDEFAIVLGGDAGAETASLIAAKVLAALRDQFSIDLLHLNLSASVGVALYPKHANTPEDLLNCADQAMYQAKKAGKDSYVFAAESITASSGGSGAA